MIAPLPSALPTVTSTPAACGILATDALDVEPVVLQVVPALRDDRTYHRKLGDRLRKIGDLELEAAQDALILSILP